MARRIGWGNDHSFMSETGNRGVIRVLLVDDHAMVRQGLRSILSTYPDFDIVGEACNGEEALRYVQTLAPSVVVMDINMPKVNGIEATARIKRAYPHIVVVGLSVNASDENRQAMTAAGATMLLTKEAAVEQLYLEIKASVNRRSSAIH
jgi:DNA-binding NarL/FixJ family response regulator